MYRSPLDRFLGATLGAYLGEALNNRPTGPEFDFSATPRARFLVLALDRPDPERLVAELDPAIDIGEAIFLALLPDLLRWHEHPERWRQRLEAFGQARSLPAGAIADYTLWGEAMTLLTRGKTSPDRLRSIFPSSDIPLSRKLATPREAIAASLAIFLETPDDFSLCLRRAYCCPCQRPITTILTGIGAGLYNGLTGFPIAWRVRGRKRPLWHEIDRRVREIHASWSGIDPIHPSPFSPSIAVAAAGTIQPRDHFRPISREDF
jgi:hypothetical protein